MGAWSSDYKELQSSPVSSGFLRWGYMMHLVLATRSTLSVMIKLLALDVLKSDCKNKPFFKAACRWATKTSLVINFGKFISQSKLEVYLQNGSLWNSKLMKTPPSGNERQPQPSSNHASSVAAYKFPSYAWWVCQKPGCENHRALKVRTKWA